MTVNIFQNLANANVVVVDGNFLKIYVALEKKNIFYLFKIRWFDRHRDGTTTDASTRTSTVSDGIAYVTKRALYFVSFDQSSLARVKAKIKLTNIVSMRCVQRRRIALLVRKSVCDLNQRFFIQCFYFLKTFFSFKLSGDDRILLSDFADEVRETHTHTHTYIQ